MLHRHLIAAGTLPFDTLDLISLSLRGAQQLSRLFDIGSR
jgi:hypothetical protein